MENQTDIIIIGVSVGVAIGILVASCVFFTIRYYRKCSDVLYPTSQPSAASLPIRVNGIGTSIDSSASISVSEIGHGSYHVGKANTHWGLQGHQGKDPLSSLPGIPRYSYKDIQKATQNFTTILGEGSFGPVYKAVMPTSEIVAVKVLANNSKQGEREFQTEVMLLSRLHHRNLVNLLGYCVDKGQHMLIYEFMSNGSLASLLYGDGQRNLSWEERLLISLDISRGIEYLHEGAVPPVIHRDLKSANILLDKSVRAKVADFGLSKEEVSDGGKSTLKGTYGYMDPDYVSTNKFTKKSDVYSFGIILFELITAINPQQGLMDYINLAGIGDNGKADWDEIVDNKLMGKSNPDEIRLLADIAYRCLHKTPKKRPSIADVTVAISRIGRRSLSKEDTMTRSLDPSGALKRTEFQHVEMNQLFSIKESPSRI
ncbi:calcium/calmodulin-regulated receptor-like kinase 2 isoform X2 [Iris pallida]|uniref:Calcium/calmodulin-regulated receptor-like kinase 2 isoform X2 n=1 Tax=Iris pallida TaxID=29817 RepID=A0AAX6GYL1_IRIPA|nr:calcium/calmodulin-regulated receptor-like kinase 2 isoform X2 [Iris pallida]